MFLEKVPGSENYYFIRGTMSSPEGSKSEWEQIIEALLSKKDDVPGKRLGIEVCTRPYSCRTRIYSDRNSQGYFDAIFIGDWDIEEWVAKAREVLKS